MEIVDLLSGAAFPFMLTAILSATIISYISYGEEDLGLQILILAVGEALLVAATAIFGKQNGVTAYRRTVQNTNKRNINSSDLRSRLYVGEYAVYKGAVIAVIVCIPFAIVNLIYAIAPNSVCEFMLVYVFGWAVFPFRLASLSPWLYYVSVIPYVAVHTAAYVWGGKVEKKKQDILARTNPDKK